MARSTSHIDEEFLSGFLDGSLSHRDMQRVRLHLEDDAQSRQLLNELRALRKTALSTQFKAPEDDVWAELPKTRGSMLTRSMGWFLLCSWLVVVCGLALWRFLSQTGDPFEIFLVLGLPGAFVLLFISVLLDRVRGLKNDRYRGVHQ